MTDNARGALLMMGAMAAFVCSDVVMKLLSLQLPLFQTLLLRGVLVCLAFWPLACWQGALRVSLPRRDRGLIALRVLAELGSTWTFLTALRHMPLANLTAILQALPLTITLAGALFFGEQVGWRRLSAISIGFLGVLLIVRPGADGFDTFALLALASVVCVTLRDLATRRMSGVVPSMAVALYTALGVTLFAAAGTLTEDWVLPGQGGWGLIVASALLIFVGYLFSIMAMRVGDLAVVSPFRYTGLVWALLLGFAVFGDWPDTLTQAGAALIVATGIYTFYRERLRAQAGVQARVQGAGPALRQTLRT